MPFSQYIAIVSRRGKAVLCDDYWLDGSDQNAEFGMVTGALSLYLLFFTVVFDMAITSLITPETRIKCVS